MPDLVPVHGGLEAPVSRTVPLSRRKQFLAEAAALPRIEMSTRRSVDGLPHRRRHAVAAHRADGRGDVAPRARSRRDRATASATTRGRRRSPSRSPTTRPRSCEVGHAAALVFEDKVVAVLRVSSLFDWDKAKHVETLLRHDPHRSSRRAHDHGRSAHEAGRRRPLGAAAAGRSRSTARTCSQPAPDAHADRRAPLGARPRVPDPQPAAPRARVRAGRRRRAAHPRGLLRRRRAEPAGRRAQGRRRPRARPHARATARCTTSKLLGTGRQGRGAVEGARLRPHRSLRAGRPRHQDAVRRPEGSRHARRSTARTTASPTSSSAASTPTRRTTTARRSGATSTPRRSSRTCAATCASAPATSASPRTTTAPAAST